MKTLQDFKDEIAQYYGYPTWRKLCDFAPLGSEVNDTLRRAADIRYAEYLNYYSVIPDNPELKSIDDIIKGITVYKSNLLHIAETEKINGSLFMALRKAFQEYGEQVVELCLKHAECEEGSYSSVVPESITRVKEMLK